MMAKKSSKKKISKRKYSRRISSVEKKWKLGLIQPFKVCSERLKELSITYELSVSGIGLIKTRPDTLQDLKKHVEEDLSHSQEADWSVLDEASLASHLDKIAKSFEVELNLREAENEAVQAQELLSKGLPMIHSQALVLLWSILESFIHALIAHILMNDKNIINDEKIRKVKIPLIYFESLDAQERSYFVIQELERQFSTSSRKGIGSLENLLNIFGLGGGLEETYRRDLLELQQIRHVMVHRVGFVDRKLTEACPWLKLKINSKINITRKALKKYFNAVEEYVIEISRRVTGIYYK